MICLVLLPPLLFHANPSETRESCPVLRITAYHDRGVTASGCRSGPGQCAAPAWVPFGSRVHVPGVGWLRVTDRTARRFRANTVDVWLPTHRKCIKFGVRYLPVRIERRR